MKIRVPYHRQEGNTTCGVACLRMLFAFHGKDVTETELEETCETSWLGNTCGELVRGSTKYGFEAEEIENVTIDDLSAMLSKKMPLVALLDPAVLYGGLEGFGHFVVITGIENDIIYYNDPDMGKAMTATIEQLFHAWSGFNCKGVRIWKSMKE
jgi:ATP-binding cassette, subfamily B, bacterial